MDFENTPPPRLWRSIKNHRSPSLTSDIDCKEGWTFDIKAPIVDFFGHDYITQFAPLDDILNGKADDIMNAAYKQDAPGQKYSPFTGTGYKFRWIHIPANNMVWVEEVIKRVCDSKAAKTQKANEARPKLGEQARTLRPGDILSPEFWKDQQRGCVEHCANHPVYARHMVPFFAEIPVDWEKKTESKVAPVVPEPLIAQDILPEVLPVSEILSAAGSKVSAVKPVVAKPIIVLSTQNAVDTPPEEPKNMVLFMPFLHWATSGCDFDHRSDVIKELSEEFKDPDYERPSIDEIKRIETSPKMRILRAFLHPVADSCLHIRRTLDQYYYSTIADADERTSDQVVYKFAKKQHERVMEEEKKAFEKWKKKLRDEKRMRHRASKVSRRSSGSLGSSKDGIDAEMELNIDTDGEMHMQYSNQQSASWDPPKIMMVNQLWMWIVDGDTVITSFPSKSRSTLSTDGATDMRDFMEGDILYDSTDIWQAVQRELRHRTNYGQRTAKSALDLAWTIADQAQGVFNKRNLHPHLQFIQMFEMEINEITYNQTKAFDAFGRNVEAAYNANNIAQLLALMTTFQKENFATRQAKAWKENFHVFALDFKKKLKQIARQANTTTIETPAQSPASSQAGDGNSSVIIRNPFFQEVIKKYAVEDGTWTSVLKGTYNQLEETIENAQSIGLSTSDIAAQILDSLKSRFEDLEVIVETLYKTDGLNRKLNDLLKASLKSLEWYTKPVMDDLFNVTNETNLVSQIKDILDELNIISCIGRQQASVIEPFMTEMLHQTLDTKDRDFHDGRKVGNHIEQLQKTAQTTYDALQDLLNMKQKQTSIIEAWSARRDAKSRAEASSALAFETVKQSGSIMIFTIVTIIFLPLSFFTGLFGMNAKELMAGNYSIGFFSAIMYPISLVIICISLGLALNSDFRLLVEIGLGKPFWTIFSRMWRVTWFGLDSALKFVKEHTLGRWRRRRGKYREKDEQWEV